MVSRIEQTKSLARRELEYGRLRRAAIFGIGAALLVGALLPLVHLQAREMVAGLSLVTLVAFAAWYGRALERAILPGVVGGLLLFGATWWSSCWSHDCAGGDECNSCMRYAILGGLLAGLAVTRLSPANDLEAWKVRAGASTATVALGALGCECVGVAGVAAGFGAMAAVFAAKTVFASLTHAMARQ